MNFNKWTLGLAAVGAVSMASAARSRPSVLVIDDTPRPAYPLLVRAGSKPTRKCLLPGCENQTSHNGGYCSAEHKREDEK